MKGRFEGWYYKHQRGDLVLSLIPGRSEEGAFVQVVTARAAYHVPYPASAFREDEKGRIRIGGNSFSSHGLELDIRTRELRLQGQLIYGRWTSLVYDIMGPFRFLPMECRHSVLSMLHDVDGQVTINGMILDFDSGIGYAEGDSGRSFPSAYSWLQWLSPAKQASVMISVGRIPLGRLQFWGCIAVVWLSGKEHRLATYLGARVRHRDERRIVIAQGKWVLEAEALETRACSLRAPTKGQMSRTIGESLAVPARIRFWANGELLLDQAQGWAGYEFVE